MSSDPNLGLSRRELQCELDVMQDLLRGLTDREIADHLGLSLDTVENYLFRIFDKLGLEELRALGAGEWSDDLEDVDTAGFAVKKPRSPNLSSGSAAASLDDVFEDRGGTSYEGAPTVRSRNRGELPLQ